MLDTSTPPAIPDAVMTTSLTLPKRALLFILLAALAGPAAAAPGDRTWFSIAAENGVLGHASQESVAGAGGRELIETRETRLREMRAPTARITSRSVVRQDAAGRTIFIGDYQRTGRSWVRLEARIADGRAHLTRETPAGRHEESVALPDDVRFDSGGGLLAAWDPAVTPRLEFANFNLGAMAVERVVITAAPAAAGDPEGGMAVLRARYEGAELRGVARLTLDRTARNLAMTRPLSVTRLTRFGAQSQSRFGLSQRSASSMGTARRAA
ncbi:MAG: hypothetical protein QOD42_535 [Sphingomonadales bacterium]|jgi:hypothetical protein|nr:hypothetical protein [Sphingomonadales bacterium]